MSGNSNGGRKYQTTTANVMRAFDKLPPEARQALANAVGNWVPQPYLTMHRRHEKDALGIASWISVMDRVELAEREHQRSRAIGPYKGNVPDATLTDRPRRRA